MGIKIDIDFEEGFRKIEKHLSYAGKKAAPKANRRALNRSLTTLRNSLLDNIRLHYRVQKKETKDGFFTSKNASGNNPNKQMAKLTVSGRAISLIRFLSKARRKPLKQKGIKVSKRKPLRLQVKPGANTTLKKAFIAQGRNNNWQVFRRRTGRTKNGKEVIARQSAPSLPKLFERVKSIRNISEANARKTYVKEFDRQFKFFLEKNK
jgi:hypothetical protein